MKKLETNWEKVYSPKLKYTSLNLKEKEALLKLLYVEYISGTNLLNIFYNLPTTFYKYGFRVVKGEYPKVEYKNLTIQYFPFTILQKVLFYTQLNLHIRRLKFEDKLIKKHVKNQLEKCSTFDIFNIVNRRGFMLHSEIDSKNFLEKNWLKDYDFSKRDLTLWKIIIRHSYTEFLL